ncbi:antibiotic biosynthesis monooxygenase [Comamonas sp.]|uniref:antibiotic biosynthesis monooxygenase family protein n=1 Tax=Comamonas sp. TaxID=34028 RepID=UPI0028A27B67|nr:antibiotic biosynthesis monooxygenase [Comamonas sp.]
MYASTFTFSTKILDDEFHRLDKQIADFARSIDGYLGEEAWEDAKTGLFSNVYYWESMEALRQLMEHPLHQEVKRRQADWLDGYQVVISEIVMSYGNGRIPHPLSGRSVRR